MQDSCFQPKPSKSHHTIVNPIHRLWWYCLFKMPCANTSSTGFQVAKSLVTPCTTKPRGRSPEILVSPNAGFGGGAQRSVSPAVDTYPVHEPGDQQGRPPRPGPTHSTPTGHPKPQVRESRAQPPELRRVDVLIHFSQPSMRNWCRPRCPALAILEALGRILRAYH